MLVQFVNSTVFVTKWGTLFLPRSSVATGICMYDSCLQELFYPIMDAYSAHIVEFNLRVTQNATAMAMTLVFIAFGALYVSNPWR